VVDVFDSKRIPLSKAQREEKKGKYRYFGATSVMDYVDDFLFDGIYLLFAEDGSVIDNNGNPFLQYVWGKFWVNNHTHILKGKNGFSTELLYVFCKKMRVSGIVNGAVQLKINQKNLLNFELIIPSNNILEKLDLIIQPLLFKLRINSDQIQTLKKTRDTLLPKLMSGQLRVSEFKENTV
jgi:type I restriction enzyme S subunit